VKTHIVGGRSLVILADSVAAALRLKVTRLGRDNFLWDPIHPIRSFEFPEIAYRPFISFFFKK